jgi:hypothetical protein
MRVKLLSCNRQSGLAWAMLGKQMGPPPCRLGALSAARFFCPYTSVPKSRCWVASDVGRDGLPAAVSACPHIRIAARSGATIGVPEGCPRLNDGDVPEQAYFHIVRLKI